MGDLLSNKMKKQPSYFLIFCCMSLSSVLNVSAEDTLPALKNNTPPKNCDQLWHGFDPRKEPLDVEVLKQWEQEGVVLKVLRYRIGTFKGKKSMMAAIYGYPKGAKKIPGLVQIHGGGQHAHYKAVLTNAKRGYATISIAWAGRMEAPDYRVTSHEVKLFWENKKDDPGYKITTDWGALDGYHAPSKHPGPNAFANITKSNWTIDPMLSPRNNSWFLCAMAARRALTFLEQQPEVDGKKLGVYGHSMGGKLTVMTAGTDSRVMAAAPSCGGISDRYKNKPLYNSTVGDAPYLQRISCPTVFLSPANDFHGRIDDLPQSVTALKTKQWRVTCNTHLNHRDLPTGEVATQLWFDQYLKGTFKWPQTPRSELQLKTPDNIPVFTVTPDGSKTILSVDIYSTQQGLPGGHRNIHHNSINKYWQHVASMQKDGTWSAKLPVTDTNKPLWVYANVLYQLDQPVSGVGYYYGDYTAKSFNLSSLVQCIKPDELKAAGVKPTLKPSMVIETFEGDWKKNWFRYHRGHWEYRTHKIYNPQWKAPAKATLSIEVKSEKPNHFAIGIDGYAADIKHPGGGVWKTLSFKPGDFKNASHDGLKDWNDIKELRLLAAEHLRSKKRDAKGKQTLRKVGGNLAGGKGIEPEFRNLSWVQPGSLLDLKPRDNGNASYRWTTDHMQVGVRWQPFIGRPGNNDHDATRAVIAKDSSYVQFWVAWSAMEPTQAYRDYIKNPSPGLQAIEKAVAHCQRLGLKVEFVFFHAPAWATIEGKLGGHRPKPGLYEQYVKRIATHFKGRVHAYQLAHEANMQGMMKGSDMDFYINDVFIKGAQTIRSVYNAAPRTPVLISTTGMSPCEGCGTTMGLASKGGKAVDRFYDMLTATPELMKLVDALNLNVSDQNNGYGKMDGRYVTSCWGNYELVRGKLDSRGYASKGVLSSESWVSWDDGTSAVDVNGDGIKNEKDAYEKTITIYGQCLERGLNTMNLPWSDNSSSWAMGLTKRLDYNGRVKQLRPDLVVHSNTGGPDVVTRKLGLRGNDGNFTIHDGGGNVFTVEDSINPGDPNHLHYSIWRWYAQIAGGPDEVVRHAKAGAKGNDIVVTGAGFTGNEQYRISSYNRSRKSFTVLIYSSGGNGKNKAQITIPATVQSGAFKAEGFAEKDTYKARVITKEISRDNGSDQDVRYHESTPAQVSGGQVTVTVPGIQRFTAIEFVREP